MNDRQRNGALAGLLVLVLALAGYSLRSRDAEATGSQAAGSTPPTASASPTPSTSASGAGGPVVFIGDSMTEGKSATAPAKRWTTLVAAELGLAEVNLGHAGTGYVSAGKKGSCGDAACPAFTGVASEVASAKPSAIVLTGGGNDSETPAAEFDAAVTATITALEKAAPSATIYVVNPWWDLRPVPASLAAQTAAVAAAADKADVVYLDTKQPLVNKPEFMVASGTNPNDAGHAALARAVHEAIAQSG